MTGRDRDLNALVGNNERSAPCSAAGQQRDSSVNTGSTTRRVRKTVTVLFTDVVGATSMGEELDPESYTDVLERFVQAARQVIGRLDGTLKDLGDGVMAMFGVPRLHEDDAQRAVAAAADLHAVLDRLNPELEDEFAVHLNLHTGINTGEVAVDLQPGRPPDVRGDPVNVASRLSDGAGPGEILLGRDTWQLVQGGVQAEPVPALAMKGKGAPVAAWRLLGLGSESVRRPRTSLIGREFELGLLRGVYERVVNGRSCHLATVLGGMGVGKTRLVDEFVRELSGAKVLRGRCLPYGDKITYRPLTHVLRQAAGIRRSDPVDEAGAKLLTFTGGDRRTANAIAPLLDLGGSSIEPEDTLRALRQLFEGLAERTPVVLVIDDLHWAEQPLLEFIGRMASSLRRAPILLICVARSEFLYERRDWGGGIPNVVSVQLLLLGEDESTRLIRELLPGAELPGELLRQLRETVAGNPFFAEELIAMLSEDGTLRVEDGQWILGRELTAVRPPSRIEAVLGTRLDFLPAEEQAVVERAAVIGLRFRPAEVATLLPGMDLRRVTTLLDQLVDKELLTPEAAALPSDETYTFRHILLQDAAYRRIAKEQRVRLHEQYAAWLELQEEVPGPLTASKIGFHLDTAYQDRLALRRRPDERTRQLARRAGHRNAEAGRQALARGLFPETAVPLLERAVELLPEEDLRVRLDAELHLAEALARADKLVAAEQAYDEVAAAARRAGEHGIERHAVLGGLEVRWFHDRQGNWEAFRNDVQSVLEELEPTDHLGIAKAHRLLAHANSALGSSTRADEALTRALAAARATGDDRLQASVLRMQCVVMYWGPHPLDEVLEYASRALAWAEEKGMASLQAGALSVLARASAMREDVAGARQLNERARAIIPDLAELLTVATNFISEGLVEYLAGDLPAAERALTAGYEALRQRGGAGALANVAALLARVLILQDRDRKAEELIRVCQEAASPTQLQTQMDWRELKALVLARRGEYVEAERLARSAVMLSERSEQPASKAQVYYDLAEILRLAGRTSEAAAAGARASELYRSKGNTAGVKRVQELLVQLGAPGLPAPDATPVA
jgi:class 3 adenylate cyclase/tetratricopeptide (TPR) repeat protein